MEAYRYYVVYEIWRDARVVGKGCCEAALKRKLCEMRDIEDMCKQIKSNKVDEGQVVIVNWKYMGEFKYESDR